MDVRFINPFIKSIRNTIETMCSMKVEIVKPELKTGDSPTADVSSVIGFSGDAAGCVVIHFPFDTASKIASKFSGIEITPEHPDFADALGELANMVAGGAKAQFDGLDVSISLPNVIIGKDHNVSASKSAPRVVFGCSTEVGHFFVEVGMKIGTPQSAQVPTTAAAGA